jgi:hypothetical protein
MITSTALKAGPAGSPGTPVASMSLDEARGVLWLRNNPRPLGELWDEGYLNRGRLAWAAQKAYDPRLKVAAEVLLQRLAQDVGATAPPAAAPPQPEPLPAIEAGITLAQARCGMAVRGVQRPAHGRAGRYAAIGP